MAYIIWLCSILVRSYNTLKHNIENKSFTFYTRCVNDVLIIYDRTKWLTYLYDASTANRHHQDFPLLQRSFNCYMRGPKCLCLPSMGYYSQPPWRTGCSNVHSRHSWRCCMFPGPGKISLGCKNPPSPALMPIAEVWSAMRCVLPPIQQCLVTTTRKKLMARSVKWLPTFDLLNFIFQLHQSKIRISKCSRP